MDQNIQTVLTGFLEFCINCFGPLLDSTLKNAYLHCFGFKKGRSIFFIFWFDRKEVKKKIIFSVFETEEIIEIIAEKQQASLKKFFLILCAPTFLLQF